MSLSIDTDHVIAVLLADGWHKVAKKSFTLDAYEYVEDDRLIMGGGHGPWRTEHGRHVGGGRG